MVIVVRLRTSECTKRNGGWVQQEVSNTIEGGTFRDIINFIRKKWLTHPNLDRSPIFEFHICTKPFHENTFNPFNPFTPVCIYNSFGNMYGFCLLDTLLPPYSFFSSSNNLHFKIIYNFFLMPLCLNFLFPYIFYSYIFCMYLDKLGGVSCSQYKVIYFSCVTSKLLSYSETVPYLARLQI